MIIRSTLSSQEREGYAVDDKIRYIFFDLDGVVFYFNCVSHETWSREGYFLNLKAHHNTVECVKWLKENCTDHIEVAFLTCADSVQMVWEKMEALKRVGLDKIMFVPVPYGRNKADYVCEDGNILVDDFGENLRNWNGIDVKFYNSINGHGGTTYARSISYDMKPAEMGKYLLDLFSA